jgi:hypothetical protein
MSERLEDEVDAQPQADRKTYEPPKIQAMSEEEVLSAFQITQAGLTWWIT